MKDTRFVALASAALILGGASPVLAQGLDREMANAQKSTAKVLAAFHDVVVKPSKSTVRIQVDGKDAALGTIVGADGWILTKASQLKGLPMCVLKDGRELPARLVGAHEKTDLAMLKIEMHNLTPVDWRDSKQAAVGNWLASPGLGEEPIAIGVVSVASRAPAMRDMPPLMTYTNSGYLGVQLEPGGDSGAKISEIVPRGPADKAGLHVADMVLAVSGKKIIDSESLISSIQRFKPGETVVLQVRRGDLELEIKATLDKRPANMGRPDIQNRLGSDLSDRRGGFPMILQHDTVLKPADCGGPLVDLDGQVVGINIARAGRTETYAIPTETVQGLLADLMSGKLAAKDESVAGISKSEQLKQAKAALRLAESESGSAQRRLEAARITVKKAEEAVKVEAEAKAKAEAEVKAKANAEAKAKAEAEAKAKAEAEKPKP